MKCMKMYENVCVLNTFKVSRRANKAFFFALGSESLSALRANSAAVSGFILRFNVELFGSTNSGAA